MSASKKRRERRRWSPPHEPDPKQKEFTLPFARRESDAEKLQVKGWLKLAENALDDGSGSVIDQNSQDPRK